MHGAAAQPMREAALFGRCQAAPAVLLPTLPPLMSCSPLLPAQPPGSHEQRGCGHRRLLCHRCGGGDRHRHLEGPAGRWVGRLGSLLWDTTQGFSRGNAAAGLLLTCIDCGVLRPVSVTPVPLLPPTPSIPLQTSTGCPQKRCWAAALRRSPFACWQCCPSFRSPSSASERGSRCCLHGVPRPLLAAAVAGGRDGRWQVARAASCCRPCRQQCLRSMPNKHCPAQASRAGLFSSLPLCCNTATVCTPWPAAWDGLPGSVLNASSPCPHPPQLQRAPHRPQLGALLQPPHDDGHKPRGEPALVHV